MPSMPGRRFAIVAPNFYPRICGVGDHSALLAAELRRRGLGVRIFTRSPTGHHPASPDLDVYGTSSRFPTLAAQDIFEHIRADQPTDALIQYTPQMWDAWRFGSPALVWLTGRLRKLGLRTTLIAHELYVPWKPRPDLAMAAALQRLQFIALLRNCDRVFVTTRSRAAAISTFCALFRIAKPEVIPVGPNAVPVDSVRPLHDRPPISPKIGLFSTAAVGKRFDVVLGAFEEIARQFPSAELVLLGDLGPADQPRVVAIRNAIARHPAAKRIRQTGRLSLAEIARELALLDLYLFPMETGANTRSGTLPAALGSGVPVIATRGRETDGLFRHDENLVFADTMSATAFAAAALRLLRDPVLSKKIGDGGRDLYQGHMTWERTADQLLADPSS